MKNYILISVLGFLAASVAGIFSCVERPNTGYVVVEYPAKRQAEDELVQNLPRRTTQYYDDLANELGAWHGMRFAAQILQSDTLWLAEVIVHPWEDRSVSVVYSDEAYTPEDAAAGVIRAMRMRPVVGTLRDEINQ